MILLLGASGYIGSAFAAELQARNLEFKTLTRQQLDYTRFDLLSQYLNNSGSTFVVNAAGYTGKPNVDACETAKAQTLLGNTLLPQMIGHACAIARVRQAANFFRMYLCWCKNRETRRGSNRIGLE